MPADSAVACADGAQWRAAHARWSLAAGRTWTAEPGSPCCTRQLPCHSRCSGPDLSLSPLCHPSSLPPTPAGEPNRKNVGSVTLEQVREIATIKLPDLNCEDVEAAMRTIQGTARNMGIAVVEA